MPSDATTVPALPETSANPAAAGAPAALAFARALADGTRQRIMRHCCCQWCSVGEIVDALGGDVTQPTVSHHLAVLREAGLVESRREGRLVLYQLDQRAVAACCGQLLVDLAPETPAAAAVREAGDAA